MLESNQIQDQAQRDRALDPAHSFIVQAPAGSGKTELLIQRYLTLLAQVEQPEAVVAITFTRKAAGEMRHRVIDALEQVNGPEPESAHERHTRTLARNVLTRDLEREWDLIDHPARLRIQTIDSLCNSLVGQMPWISRMGAAPRPDANAGHLYRRAAHQTLELLETEAGCSEDLGRLLAHLDNNVSAVESLISSMLARRDQWLRHVVGKPDDKAFRDAIESALEQIVLDELELIRQGFPDQLAGQAMEVASGAARNLIREHSESPITNCSGMGELPSVEDCGGWLGIAELFLTQKGEARKMVNKRQGFAAGSGGARAKEEWARIVFDDAFRERLHGVRALPPTALTETQWEILRGLKQVLPTAAGQLHLVFQKEGRVDFTEVASAARYALGTADTPTELAFILDCRIEHLLVDEFQDTSETQYQLLERLIGDWQVGDGRTLFLVGDPMQSIYGFREAEVALFLRARQTGIGNIPLEQIVLSVNFRSTFDIVRWVNQGLGPAFPDIEDTYTGAVAYSPSVAFTGSGHDTDDTDDTSAPDDSEEAVTIHAYLDSDAEPEARQVLEIVRYTERINPQGTIAVLVRARSHLASIVSEFRRAEVQFQAVELAPLGERPVVGDLLALTRALIHPADRIAWLSILRAPWCGLTLVDLHFLVGGDDTSAVWDLIRDPERAGRLSPESGRRLARVIAVLDQALPRYGRVGLRRWVEATWMSLGGPASVNDATDLEDASVFLDLLEDSTAGVAIEDEAKFVDDVRRLYAKPNVDAPTNEEGKVLLQLLTVHKAKGLEFDTVILPGLGRYTRGQSASLMLWLEYADRNGRDRLLLAPAKETGRSDDALYAYLGRVKAKKSDHEDTRMLYVAATRARKKLHLLGHTRVDPKGAGCMPPDQRSPLRKIWPAVRTDFESAFAVRGVVDVGDETEAVRPIDVQGIPLRRLSADWSPPPPTTESGPKLQGAVGMVPEDEEGAEDPVVHPTFDWATELQRRVGIVVHAMLQRMSADGRLEWRAETVTSALVSEGLAGEKLAEAARRVNAALERTVSDDRGIWILAEHEDDGRELALTGVVDDRPRNIIIDRTFVDSGVRWIIDYKTGTHEGGGRSAFLDNEQRRYAPQLEKYGRVMQQIEERPIRLALYYPMLQGWREWPFEGLAPA